MHWIVLILSVAVAMALAFFTNEKWSHWNWKGKVGYAISTICLPCLIYFGLACKWSGFTWIGLPTNPIGSIFFAMFASLMLWFFALITWAWLGKRSVQF